jgi:flagellar motility protein MotE (MotC chaperone)
MTRFLRDLRLIPIAVVACACLLALVLADILLDDNSLVGGNALVDAGSGVIRATPDTPSSSALSWASQMFNCPDGRGAAPASGAASRRADRINPDITGSIPETAPGEAKPTEPKVADAKPTDKPGTKPPETKPAGTLVMINGQAPPSGAERAILERLQERRQELDTRARELDIRESLMQAAEKRMDGKLAEVKETEQRITVATQQKDDAQAARFKGLVTMYENMKPRDAAKIFDRLDIGVLIDVASKIEPRKMSDILAQMSPDTAQRLTVELASQAHDNNSGGNTSAAGLPKIQSQP